MGEYWVTGAIVLLCVGFAIVTRHYADSPYSPFFFDWADCYKQGLCDAKEWKDNRFRWL
jgi:inner membrane protein